MALRTWLRSRRTNPTPQHARKPRARLGVQLLEDRAVPAAGFLSAFSPASATGSSEARDVAVDAAGNSYLTGFFTGTVDFDPADPEDAADTLTARGSHDAFVAKYAPNDALVWVRRMGGDAIGAGAMDVGGHLALDGGGNVLVAGRFMGAADFGPVTLTAAGDCDAFVVKLNANGDVSWATSWGNSLYDTGIGVGADAAGNVYALGIRTDPAATANNDWHDVLKFSPAGALTWTRSVATRHALSGGDLAVDASGNVYAAGTFQGVVDFDPGNRTQLFASGVNYAGFVLKLTSAGNYGWASTFYGQGSGSTAGFSAAQSVALDGAGNVIVGGYYGNSVDFDPGNRTTTLPADGKAFLVKLNNKGSLAWAKALVRGEAGSFAYIYSLAADATGNIYATGNFYGTVDFDPGTGTHSRTSSGGSDVFVMKLNSAGAFQWAETVGGTGYDTGWGVAVSSAGVVHLAGGFTGLVDFDPDPLANFDLSVPRSNFFLLKLRQT